MIKYEQEIISSLINFNGSKVQFWADPREYQIEPGVFYLPDIEKQAYLPYEECPYIKEIKISIPAKGSTCPAKCLMCFSSMEKVEDLSLIHRFYSCEDVDSALRIGNKLQIQANSVEGGSLDIACIMIGLAQKYNYCAG